MKLHWKQDGVDMPLCNFALHKCPYAKTPEEVTCKNCRSKLTRIGSALLPPETERIDHGSTAYAVFINLFNVKGTLPDGRVVDVLHPQRTEAENTFEQHYPGVGYVTVHYRKQNKWWYT